MTENLDMIEAALEAALEALEKERGRPKGKLELLPAGEPITGAQCRGARGMCHVGNQSLAVASGINTTKISRFEFGIEPKDKRDVLDLRSALEGFGAVFYANGAVGSIKK